MNPTQFTWDIDGRFESGTELFQRRDSTSNTHI
jgi:hypothetical protein